MHRALQRQLKRTLGVSDPEGVVELCRRLRSENPNLSPELSAVVDGFEEFVQKIDATYEQQDRDIDLRTRSLELSSAELSEANEKLRADIMARKRAMGSLKQVLANLLSADTATDDTGDKGETGETGETGDTGDKSGADGDSLENLSGLIQTVVAERELQRNKLDNLKFALDEHAIVSITDTSGAITYANDRFCSISGYTREELLGRNHRIVKSAQHSPEFYQTLWLTISAGKVWEGELCNRAKNGELYWVAATIVPLLDADGLPHEYIAIRTDITAQKLTEQALAISRDAAEAASRAKSEFLANMSHEIRTPMNGVIGMTDLALDTELDDEQREYLSVVKSSAQALLIIINDILDFSKVEAGQLTIEAIPFDPRRTLSETLKTMAPKAHEKSLELVCDIDDRVPARLIGDPGRLRQIVVNLVGNAVKFTSSGAVSVHFSCLDKTDTRALLKISVKDSGIGIPADKLDLIFDAFAQVDASTTRKYGGTGLGLTICRRLVELMGGTIGVTSVTGSGSDFHFTVSLDIAPATDTADLPLADLRGKRALVVDDNMINQQVLLRLLERWGVSAQGVLSGSEAMDWLNKETPPDLILLDVQMPDMDGFAVAEWVRKQAALAAIRIIILSSGSARGDGQRCRDLGIDGYFPKPVVGDDLHTALGALFSRADTALSAHPTLITRHSVSEMGRGLSVLLVEDHPVNQKLAIRLLEKWGHSVTLAQDGQAALELFLTHRFDVCLMDMQMPIMGGVECTQNIRQREADHQQPPLYIIAMTANAMKGDREACLEAGMNDYVAKPIKADELKAKLTALVREQPPEQRSITLNSAPKPPVDSEFNFARGLASMDQEILEIIAPAFIEHYQTDMAALRTALNNGDFAALARTAHSLKGTLASFHATPAQRTAAAIESAAGANTGQGITEAIDELDIAVAHLVTALHTWTDNLA